MFWMGVRIDLVVCVAAVVYACVWLCGCGCGQDCKLRSLGFGALLAKDAFGGVGIGTLADWWVGGLVGDVMGGQLDGMWGNSHSPPKEPPEPQEGPQG